MKKFVIYLNCKPVKEAQKLSTAKRYFDMFCKLYDVDNNIIDLYDNRNGAYILSVEDVINDANLTRWRSYERYINEYRGESCNILTYKEFINIY